MTETAAAALSPIASAATDAHDGLSSEEAARRLLADGRNEIDGGPTATLLRQVLRQLREPMNVLLLSAASVSALVGETASFFIIAAMVILGIVLDTVQERRASNAASMLKAQVALKETVVRDGREMEIESSQIVRGDLVRLSAGDVVPADGHVLAAVTFSVNEASLTGEPYPVDKLPEGAAPNADAKLFAGTSVVSGKADLRVETTGRNTQLGKLAGKLSTAASASPLDKGAQSFGFLIMRLTTLLAGFVLVVDLALGRPLLESLLFALALAVGMTPELLPMVISVTLARGAVRLAKGKVIVKRLAAIHDLGAMTVLCTDKTGTLTDARISLARAVAVDASTSETVRRLAALNSAFARGLNSPLDDALREVAIDSGGWAGVDEAPFDFVRRRSSVLLARGEARVLVTKGAPEEMLAVCGFIAPTGISPLDGGPLAAAPRPMTQAERADALAMAARLGEGGERALAVAWKLSTTSANACRAEDEIDLVFAGYVTLTDPPKASAQTSIAELARLGVAVKILTGDSAAVTRRVCREIGMDAAESLEGRDIDKLDEAGLAAAAQRTSVFCRLNPAQKNRIILSLQRRGEVVGYVGDGVNDAPSLHDADVGLSVEGAVDVAREAADIILLAPDLAILAEGVREGRRTFGNIMKYVLMAVSSNFGNMISMAGAAVFLPFFPMTAIQILLNNLIYDLSETTIPLDEVDEADIARPRSWDIGRVTRFMLIMGPISSVFDFATFGILLFGFHAGAEMFQSAWFTESLASQSLVVFIIRTAAAPWRSRPHRWLAASAFGAAALAVLIPMTPLGALFGLRALPPLLLGAILMLIVAYLGAAELGKRLFLWMEIKRARPPAAPTLSATRFGAAAR